MGDGKVVYAWMVAGVAIRLCAGLVGLAGGQVTTMMMSVFQASSSLSEA